MIELSVTDVGRDTVTLTWKRAWNDPGTPTSYVILRAEPPAALDRIALVMGRKFIDPDCSPSTTYTYEVRTIGLPVIETDSIQITTRPPTEFTGPGDFFTRYLSLTFARDPQLDTVNWCPHWRLHHEALAVVTELWRSYEAHRPPADPLVPTTERAVWLTVYAYPLMDRLFNPQGAFKGCWLDGGHGGAQLPLPG